MYKRQARYCAHDAISFDENRRASIDHNKCVGCGRCIGTCNFDAIENVNYNANDELNCKIAEYAKAVVDVYKRQAQQVVQDDHGQNQNAVGKQFFRVDVYKRQMMSR